MGRLASGHSHMVHTVVIACGHQPEESQRLDAFHRSCVRVGNRPHNLLTAPGNLRVPTSLAREKRGMCRNHPRRGLARAPGRADPHPETVGQDLGANTRANEQLVHVDQMFAKTVNVDAGPVGVRVRGFCVWTGRTRENRRLGSWWDSH